MRRADPMSPEVRIEVLRRDGGCIAMLVDPHAGVCGSASPGEPVRLEVDHVRPAAGAKTVSDARHCVTLCSWHHRGSRAGVVWATAHRPELRAYLARLYEQVAA